MPTSRLINAPNPWSDWKPGTSRDIHQITVTAGEVKFDVNNKAYIQAGAIQLVNFRELYKDGNINTPDGVLYVNYYLIKSPLPVPVPSYDRQRVNTYDIDTFNIYLEEGDFNRLLALVTQNSSKLQLTRTGNETVPGKLALTYNTSLLKGRKGIRISLKDESVKFNPTGEFYDRTATITQSFKNGVDPKKNLRVFHFLNLKPGQRVPASGTGDIPGDKPGDTLSIINIYLPSTALEEVKKAVENDLPYHIGDLNITHNDYYREITLQDAPRPVGKPEFAAKL